MASGVNTSNTVFERTRDALAHYRDRRAVRKLPELTLPAPAQQLHEQARDRFDKWFGASGWATGGGSVLAARWQHRQSRDLDLFVLRMRLDRWRQGRSAGTLARTVERVITPWRPVRIEVQNNVVRIGNPIAQVDLIAWDPPNPAREWAAQRIAGSYGRTLTSAAILGLKLRMRGPDTHARDVYDYACALQYEPEALDEALRSVPGTVLPGMIRHRIQNLQTRWSSPEVRERIDGPNNETAWEHAPQLVLAAIEAEQRRRSHETDRATRTGAAHDRPEAGPRLDRGRAGTGIGSRVRSTDGTLGRSGTDRGERTTPGAGPTVVPASGGTPATENHERGRPTDTRDDRGGMGR